MNLEFLSGKPVGLDHGGMPRVVYALSQRGLLKSSLFVMVRRDIVAGSPAVDRECSIQLSHLLAHNALQQLG